MPGSGEPGIAEDMRPIGAPAWVAAQWDPIQWDPMRGRARSSRTRPSRAGRPVPLGSGRVLLDQGTEAREGGLDVLDAARAHGVVRLLNWRTGGVRGARVGHREQGLGDLVA